MERIEQLIKTYFPGRTILAPGQRETTSNPEHTKLGICVSIETIANYRYRLRIFKGSLDFVYKQSPRDKYKYKYYSRTINDHSWEEDAIKFSNAMKRGRIHNGIRVVSARIESRNSTDIYNNMYSLAMTPEAVDEDDMQRVRRNYVFFRSIITYSKK